MSKNCPIMGRMKKNYENRSKTFLIRRTPVILRLDGKAFHTYTKGLEKPFDEGLIEDMAETAVFLCSNIQGAKCAYVQSDEISILITDYDKLTSEAWFDYGVQKIVSVSASLATAKFNDLRKNRNKTIKDKIQQLKDSNNYGKYDELINEQRDLLISEKLAFFDSRCFNIPKEDAVNYFVARQRDAVKNSISMLAQSLYSPKELNKKNASEMQEMSFQKGHNWNDLHWNKKRGSFVVKNTYVDGENKGYLNGFTVDEKSVIRTKWEVVETPLKFDDSVFSIWL